MKRLGFEFLDGSPQTLITLILGDAHRSPRKYVAHMNVHMLVEALRNNAYRESLRRSAILTADGKPIYLLLSIFSDSIMHVRGIDLMHEILSYSNLNSSKILLFGGTKSQLSILEAKISSQFKNLELSTYAPPFSDQLFTNSSKYIQIINSRAPDFVLVSLGCPKQEKWCSLVADQISAPLFAVGGAFSIFAGIYAPCPPLLSRLSLEWFWRLCKEPRRLWRRYFFTNLIFTIFLIPLLILLILDHY